MRLVNQKGSILLLVMVISVVMALIISHLYTTIEQSRRGQASRSDIEAYHHFIYALKAQLEDPLSCHALLGGVVLPAGPSGRIRNLTLPWTFQGSVPPFRPGSVIPNTRLTIEDIQILRTGAPVRMRDPLPSPLPSPRPPATFTERVVSIVNGASVRPHSILPIRVLVPISGAVINLGLDDTKPIVPPENIPPMKRDDLMIQLYANVDVNRRIYNCYGHESFAYACQTMGGAFNHRGPSDLKCQPDLNCFTGNPSLVKNPAACRSQGTAPFNYKAVRMGAMGALGDPLYICQLCRQDLIR